MEEDDLEFSMARIRAMKEAKKNLENEIREEMKYIDSMMRDRLELRAGSFKAKVVTRNRKGAMSLKKITELLGKDAADKVTTESTSRFIEIVEVYDGVERFAIRPNDLVPEWVRAAYQGLNKEEE